MAQSATPLPQMFVELTISSLETIARRSMLMATGACTLGEYTAMVTVKMGALQSSTLTMLTGGSLSSVMAPWHAGATANAKRLREG